MPAAIGQGGQRRSPATGHSGQPIDNLRLFAPRPGTVGQAGRRRPPRAVAKGGVGPRSFLGTGRGFDGRRAACLERRGGSWRQAPPSNDRTPTDAADRPLDAATARLPRSRRTAPGNCRAAVSRASFAGRTRFASRSRRLCAFSAWKPTAAGRPAWLPHTVRGQARRKPAAQARSRKTRPCLRRGLLCPPHKTHPVHLQASNWTSKPSQATPKSTFPLRNAPRRCRP